MGRGSPPRPRFAYRGVKIQMIQKLFISFRRPAFFLIAGLAAVFISSVCANTSSAGGPETFRVMCYNIHHARGLDREVSTGRIARIIESERADIAGIQEVDRGTRRTGGRDLVADLSELSGMAGIFRRNHPVQGGEYGNAILTRFPYRDAENSHLPMIGSREQRGVLRAVIEVHGQEILFLNTHLAHRATGEAERLASVAEFEAILKENDEGPNLPVIFVGDFNAVPGTETYERMARMLVDIWPVAGVGGGDTIPVRMARRRIDYVWISPDAPFEPVRAWVPYTEASDHRPLVVEFRMLR